MVVAHTGLVGTRRDTWPIDTGLRRSDADLVTEPLVQHVPEALRKHGWSVVALLAGASIAVVFSALLWDASAAKHWMLLRMVLAPVLMLPASLVALVLMPPERAAAHKATPGLFRFWVALWVAELALGVVVLLLYASSDLRQFVGALPDWAQSVLVYLLVFAFVTWFGFGWVLVAELWHWARGTLSNLLRRPSRDP